MKEISRQNIVLSPVAVIMLVLILTIGFFAIPRHHFMFAHLRYPWNKILFMEFSEMVCHFPSHRHRFGHLYYYSDYIHITTSNF